jgi:phosphopantothenoylcysteine decarboxylase/phosphopantothenate--cysteine ligase
MNVVVTSGATREPIDSVRFISNVSSGRTGAAICEALAARGFGVTQLHGVESAIAQRVARRETFTDHVSLDAALRRLLRDSSIGAVIHAAAVSDFALAEPVVGAKIESGQPLVLELRPTPKIIDRLHGYAGNHELLVIGFKLTHEADPEAQARAARDLMVRSRARYVVQNDVSTLGSEQHAYAIHESGSSRVRRYLGRVKLAAGICALLEEHDTRNRR